MTQHLQIKDTRQVAAFDPSKGTFGGVFELFRAVRANSELEQIGGLIYTGIIRFLGVV